MLIMVARMVVSLFAKKNVASELRRRSDFAVLPHGTVLRFIEPGQTIARFGVLETSATTAWHYCHVEIGKNNRHEALSLCAFRLKGGWRFWVATAEESKVCRQYSFSH